MYFKKGTVEYDTAAIMPLAFSIRPIRSPRGRRYSYRVSLQGTGELQVDPSETTELGMQDDIRTQMFALESNFYNDYESVGFYQDDDTVTTHYIDTDAANNYTGTLLDYLNWTTKEPHDFCTSKTFDFGFKADFIDSYTGIYSWEDSIVKMGDAGAIYDWRLHPTLGAFYTQKTVSSMQRFVHRGKAVGLHGYPDPPPPLCSRPNLLGQLTKEGKFSGKLWGQPGAYALFTVVWEYQYIFPTNQILDPQLG